MKGMRYMNISSLINDIIDEDGLHQLALPYKEPLEVVVQNSIARSVRTFSQFKRQEKEGFYLVKDLKAPTEVDRFRRIYLLPPELTTTNVIDVFGTCETDQAVDSRVNMNTFTVGSPFVGFGSYYPQDILNAQMIGTAINKFAGVTSRLPTVEYKGYNKIQLHDFPDNACVHLIVECEHDSSCESIPESMRESFKELAMLDLETQLYNDLKNNKNVGSGYQQNQIQIEDWAGSKGKKEELVKRWTDTAHCDDTDGIMFF